MEIRTVELTKYNDFLVNKNVNENDDRQLFVPDDMGNYHRSEIQKWIDAGNTPAPYVEPKPLYQNVRVKAYGRIGDQLDMQYKDLVNGTTVWKDHIAKVKSDIPKE